MARSAVVHLLTTDSYLPGVLVSHASLLDAEGGQNQKEFDTVCIVTPETVSQRSIKALQNTFDCVVGVAQIESDSWANLDLLGRRDLAASLTKLHLFRLTQYSKLIFLDADTLVLRKISDLFKVDAPFAAAPDIGWPDAFNSGVMVATPSQQTFTDLIAMMAERGSWDGGDQGLLNDYFSDWHRLSFKYNVTPSAYYTYAPAYKRHGSDIAVLHFIGNDKPWKRGYRATYDPQSAIKDYYGLVNQWYDVYERHYGVTLTHDVASKVIVPPSSFKSTYSELGPYEQPAKKGVSASEAPTTSTTDSVPIPGLNEQSGRDSPPKLTWDPAKSSPPRGQSHFQMREPITDHYDNMWDDPSRRRQKERFQPPSNYAPVPSSTHDWYRDVMQQQPNPQAVKPVFPWEKDYDTRSAEAQSRASTVAQPPPAREFPSSRAPSPPLPPSDSKEVFKTFVNAWDTIPGINRYAKNLAKATRRASSTSGQAAPLDVSKSAQVAARKNDLSNRQSSMKELKSTDRVTATTSLTNSSSQASDPNYGRRGDASSRDGDDEDETTGTSDDDDEDERDRPPIIFRRSSSGNTSASPTHSRSGSHSQSSARVQQQQQAGRTSSSSSGSSTPRIPIGVGSAQLSSSPSKSKSSKYVPTSPRQSRASVALGEMSSVHNNNQRGGLKLNVALPSVAQQQQAAAAAASANSSMSSSGAISPRLAIRNSAAARFTSSGIGTGDGPPLVRATRVFSPETDTTVVKQQGLAALQRFVEDYEASTGNNTTGGGAGTAGSWRS
ncbi:glycogenin glucosyltransferase [Microbotryomycetes sp. JL221]|nr:glycogenin glucosyltransferase [Microbotryomycetes sp. JL221]